MVENVQFATYVALYKLKVSLYSNYAEKVEALPVIDDQSEDDEPLRWSLQVPTSLRQLHTDVSDQSASDEERPSGTVPTSVYQVLEGQKYTFELENQHELTIITGDHSDESLSQEDVIDDTQVAG